MILFVWSLLISAFDYFRRRRLCSQIRTHASANTGMIIRRMGTAVRPLCVPLFRFDTNVTALYRTNSVELLSIPLKPVVDSLGWQVFEVSSSSTIINHRISHFLFDEPGLIYFIASVGLHSKSAEGNVLDVEAECIPIAWRSDDHVDVLFACDDSDRFTKCVGAYADRLLIYQSTFEIEHIQTVALSPEFLRQLYCRHSPCKKAFFSSAESPPISNGHVVTSLSRPYCFLKTLEEFCLNDIIASRKLCDSVLASNKAVAESWTESQLNSCVLTPPQGLCVASLPASPAFTHHHNSAALSSPTLTVSSLVPPLVDVSTNGRKIVAEETTRWKDNTILVDVLDETSDSCCSRSSLSLTAVVNAGTAVGSTSNSESNIRIPDSELSADAHRIKSNSIHLPAFDSEFTVDVSDNNNALSKSTFELPVVTARDKEVLLDFSTPYHKPAAEKEVKKSLRFEQSSSDEEERQKQKQSRKNRQAQSTENNIDNDVHSANLQRQQSLRVAHSQIVDNILERRFTRSPLRQTFHGRSRRNSAHSAASSLALAMAAAPFGGVPDALKCSVDGASRYTSKSASTSKLTSNAQNGESSNSKNTQQHGSNSSLSRSPTPLPPDGKPPNILVYTGRNDVSGSLSAKLVRAIVDCVALDRYTIYPIQPSVFSTGPWKDNTHLLVMADTSTLNDEEWQTLFAYFKSGGRILFICQNYLLSYLTNCASAKKRFGILKQAFPCEHSSKELEKFLKHVSTKLKNQKVSEKFEFKRSDGSHEYFLSVLRDSVSPLLMYMQNSHKHAGALFSDVTVEALLKAGGTKLITEALRRLGIAISEMETITSGLKERQVTPGCLFLNNQASAKAILDYLSDETKRTVSGSNLALHFVEADKTPLQPQVSATDKSIPVYFNVNAKGSPSLCQLEDTEGFSFSVYFENLTSKTYGQCVLFLPVVNSSQNVFQNKLFASVAEKAGLVAIARQQTQGQGRSGNQFLSPLGCAMFSICLSIDLNSDLSSCLGFLQHLVVLSVVDGVRSLPGYENVELRLKWPNDIYIGKAAKIGGVLVTSIAQNQTVTCVMGCGVNVSNSIPTTCINNHLPNGVYPLTVEMVIARAMSKFEELLQMLNNKGVEAVLPIYYKYWLHENQEVTLGGTGQKAVIRGLDRHGYLKVKLRDNGETISLQPDGNTFDMMHNLIRMK